MKSNAGGAKVYIVLAFVIVVALLMMFVLLSMASNAATKKPHFIPTTKSTTKAPEPIIVTNFSAPLSLIIGDLEFLGDYEHVLRYSGAEFTFKCRDYQDGKCLMGSAIMDVGTSKVELFNYDSDTNNYLLKANEYYIIVNDDYIILTMNKVSKVLGRDGKEFFNIDDVITKYRYNNETYNSLYPTVVNNEFTYYAYSNSKVKISSINLVDHNEVKVIENIAGAICD